MSQYQFKQDEKTIICGFDKRMNYVFMTIHNQNMDTLYSNMTIENPFETKDINFFIDIAKNDFDITFPEDIIRKIVKESGGDLPISLKEVHWKNIEDTSSIVLAILDKYNMTIDGFSDRNNHLSIKDKEGFNSDFYKEFKVKHIDTELPKKEENKRWSLLEKCAKEVNDALQNNNCTLSEYSGYEIFVFDEIGYNTAFRNHSI